MSLFQSRLFFRIIAKNREVYLLKIVTLAIAFACSILILLFSLNEFGYDRFHDDAGSVFRVLQRNTSESFSGNRLSNRIPLEVFAALQVNDSMVVSRVKVMNEVSIAAEKQNFHHQKIHAADAEIADILSFEFVDGSFDQFKEKVQTAILSVSAAHQYFGTAPAVGKKIKIYTFGDTLLYSVAAIYKDFPQNSHEAFTVFIRFDAPAIQSLGFGFTDTGVYGRTLYRTPAYYEVVINNSLKSQDLIYKLQPLPAVYFGPRVTGEDAKHGDAYSILILICITGLILFLALTSFVNLTTLTLPYRSKELAVKKLAGTSQLNLIIAFARESLAIVAISIFLGILLLLITADFIVPILSINLTALLISGDAVLVLIISGLVVISGIAPLLMTFKFTRATPSRLLSTQTITFPRFKRMITFLQLGTSIFLIVASMVMKRQINYSLLKEPGRNYDQIVYMRYPTDMTNEGLLDLRSTWKKNNPNIVDVMATSQLPDQISSKELNSEFYSMSVDAAFAEFFDLKMVQGKWFSPNDGDSIIVVNEKAKSMLGNNGRNVIGVIQDMSGQFNLPEKPIKINVAPYFHYNFLCVRVLEVDIRSTVDYLSRHFGSGAKMESVSFLNKRFEEWLRYQDRLNTLSEVLAIISALLSCCAVYGLSVSLVRDKLKQIAIHKLWGATTVSITRMLVREFARQMLLAILVFGPLTYIIVKELLRNFVYSTHFNWLDPLIPLAYCAMIITILCGFQALSLNRADLSNALK